MCQEMSTGILRDCELRDTDNGEVLQEDCSQRYSQCLGRSRRKPDNFSLVTQDVLLMAGSKEHYMPLSMPPDQLMGLTAA